MSSLALPFLVLIFAGRAAVIWIAGIQLSNTTDVLDNRLHLGSAPPEQVSGSRTRGGPSPIAPAGPAVLPAPFSPASQAVPKEPVQVFLFFSSRLGCLGSLAVSVILTLILLAIFHVL